MVTSVTMPFSMTGTGQLGHAFHQLSGRSIEDDVNPGLAETNPRDCQRSTRLQRTPLDEAPGFHLHSKLYPTRILLRQPIEVQDAMVKAATRGDLAKKWPAGLHEVNLAPACDDLSCDTVDSTTGGT